MGLYNKTMHYDVNLYYLNRYFKQYIHVYNVFLFIIYNMIYSTLFSPACHIRALGIE